MKKFLIIIKNVIVDIVKGMFVGLANIIPGVSGGTMAVSLSIYDKIIESLSNLTKKFKDGFLSLLPIAIGMVIGIGVFSLILPTCLEKYAFPTCMCFCGLIVGGIPELINNTKNAMKEEGKRINPIHIVLFILLCGVAVWGAIVNPTETTASSLNVDALTIVKLLVVGAAAAATMVIPGVSGSLLLMILGFYSGIIGTIKNLLYALKAFDGSAILHCILILLPFAVGCVAGILLISRLISWLLKKHPSYTYSAILGLVFASPFAVLYKMQNPVFSPLFVIIGIVLFILAAGFTYMFGKKK